jgi:hypothetical protein
MNTESLITELEIATEFTDAMQARDVPEKFFYWQPLAVQAWTALARDPAYDGMRRAWAAAALKTVPIVEHFGPKMSVVSLGAGDGSKDRLVIEALRGTARDVKYFPVDASQALLEIACSAAEDAEIEALGIKADISSPMHLLLASDAAESPRLFLMSGNTLGAFDPLDQIRHVAQCMKPGDRLVIDAELYPENTEVDDNQPLRTFAFAPLASVGVVPDDGELRFEWKRDERRRGLHLLARHFRAGRDLRITALPEELVIARGERIALNFQYMFTPEAFTALLTEHARLRILDQTSSTDGRLLIALCGR